MAKEKMFPKAAFGVEWLRAGDISVKWASAQRQYSEQRAADMAENFDPDAFGVVTVGRVHNGRRAVEYHIIDGQHRLGALRILGWDDQLVPCQIREVSSAAEAAAMFDKLNTARQPTAVERFKVRVTGGHERYPDEATVAKLVKNCGFTISKNPGASSLSGVGKLMKIYHAYGPEVLADVLTLVRKVWKDDDYATQTPILEGFAVMLHEFPEIDRERLTQKVGMRYTASNLLAAADANRGLLGGSRARNIVRVMVHTYNQGLRGEGKLEE